MSVSAWNKLENRNLLWFPEFSAGSPKTHLSSIRRCDWAPWKKIKSRWSSKWSCYMSKQALWEVLLLKTQLDLICRSANASRYFLTAHSRLVSATQLSLGLAARTRVNWAIFFPMVGVLNVNSITGCLTSNNRTHVKIQKTVILPLGVVTISLCCLCCCHALWASLLCLLSSSQQHLQLFHDNITALPTSLYHSILPCLDDSYFWRKKRNPRMVLRKVLNSRITYTLAAMASSFFQIEHASYPIQGSE